MDMNNKLCGDIYSRIYHIVIEEFEFSEIPQPVLDFVIFKTEYYFYPCGNISAITTSPPRNWEEFHANGGKLSTHTELSNGGDAGNFLYQIEEEFDMEISDESFEKMVTFKDVLEIVLEQKYNLGIAEYLEIQIKTKTIKLLLFLESKKIEINNFREIFLSNTFSSNHKNIEKLILSLRDKSLDVSSIMSFSDIFKNDFLLSNLEQICQIYCFMNNQEISYFDVIEIIKSGYLDSCKQEIDDLSEKIRLQESEIKKLSLELEKANQNLDSLRSQLNYLLEDI
jgi:hypothetical protein